MSSSVTWIGKRAKTPDDFKKNSLPESGLKLHFNPTGILQNFGIPLSFRWKTKTKINLSPQSLVPPQRELIELASFGLVEVDPGGEGLGHKFIPSHLRNPTWCDRCGDFLWGLEKVRDCVQCQYCRYTCHKTCQELITLDCKGVSDTPLQDDDLSDIWEDARDTLTSVKSLQLSSLVSHQELSEEELSRRIDNYNATSPNLQMSLDSGTNFNGFIRVHLNLTRPINVISGTRPPSIYDIMKDEDEDGHRTLTSFYLPHDTIKALHITSDYTCREVIVALLKKFKVADNPLKFALYQRSREDDQLKFSLLNDLERPLVLALLWDGTDKQFVLQENDTGDIMWDGFALAELNNFLKILDKEEADSIELVKAKYQLIQERLEEALAAANS